MYNIHVISYLSVYAVDEVVVLEGLEVHEHIALYISICIYILVSVCIYVKSYSVYMC